MLKFLNQRFEQFFWARAPRERFLLALILVVAAGFWFTFLNKSFKTVMKDAKGISELSDYQAIWLDNEEAIQERLNSMLAIMDPSKTYTRQQFLARLDTLARPTKLTYNLTNPVTKEQDIFLEHTLTLNLSNITMKDLLSIDQKISAESPYIGISALNISPRASDPARLSVKLELVALELKSSS